MEIEFRSKYDFDKFIKEMEYSLTRNILKSGEKTVGHVFSRMGRIVIKFI